MTSNSSKSAEAVCMTTVKPTEDTQGIAPAHAPGKYDLVPAELVNRLIKGTCSDVFAVLGMHPHVSGDRQVTVFLPGAIAVEVISPAGHRKLGELLRIHEEGLFSGLVSRKRQVPYRLKITYAEATIIKDDPYRFPSLLDATDLYLFNNGTQEQCWRFLGANHRVCDDVAGIMFAVWAPNAHRVSVVSDANHWDGRTHVMRKHPGSGIWDIFIPGIPTGACYKFELIGADGRSLTLKADPFAKQMQLRPDSASVVASAARYEWQDNDWMEFRRNVSTHGAPVSIYEVHPGSWKVRPEEGNRWLSYRELAHQLLPYAKQLGFTHIQLMPVSEYPFDGSWGYQPIGLYAPTRRFGEPDDFRYFVDQAHLMGLGILLDWVPGHFPSDTHGLARFDGTHLYEHEDERKGKHPDWETCIYNYGRAEVQSFLISNALYWLDEFHIDGLRVDAVASMLYLDYSRKEGEWMPNHLGGRENIEAIEFLRNVNARAYFNFPGVMMIAEESTAWPGVTNFIERGGLGFGYKWNMGWMNDTLRYLSRDPVHRKFHHNEMTFSLLYAFSENFILPLSHDEVVHGKRSILDRVPGYDQDKFSTLRAYYAFMWTHPGKKLLFMGDEFAQRKEWDHQQSLDWHLLEQLPHQGVSNLIADLNLLYRSCPALYELDHSPEGFEWVDADNYLQSVFIFRRKSRVSREQLLVVVNMTPMAHPHYRIGVPAPGFYQEKINTDAVHYGGSGQGNLGGVQAEDIASHGCSWSLPLTLPPLSALVFSADVY
jgi:1,4-alpha-glucan branching enzyme